MLDIKKSAGQARMQAGAAEAISAVSRKGRGVINTIIEDLNRERPDLNASGMAVAGRIVVLANAIQKRVDALLGEYGLAQWSFDVLATLRRAGSPYHRSPTELSRSTMLSTAAMVNRLDRLEERSLVRRLPNPEDRRGVIVELTRKGFDLVDGILPLRLEEAEKIAAILSDKDRKELERLLGEISKSLDGLS